jgi:hypothetical protein
MLELKEEGRRFSIHQEGDLLTQNKTKTLKSKECSGLRRMIQKRRNRMLELVSVLQRKIK